MRRLTIPRYTTEKKHSEGIIYKLILFLFQYISSFRITADSNRER